MSRRNATLAAVVLTGGTLLSGAASATTTTFSGLADANGTPVATYAEGGFTVTSTVGQFFQAQVFGNPVPDLFAAAAGGGPVVAALEVTKNGGGSFDFASVDLAANNGDVAFTLTGFLGGVQQYVFNGVEPGRSGLFGFDTITNPNATVAVDDVRISLDIRGTSGNLDNIVVNPIAAPEPASILLLGSALVGLGFLRRLRQQRQEARAEH